MMELELATTLMVGTEVPEELLQLEVHEKVKVVDAVIGVLEAVRPQVAVTVYVPETPQEVLPPTGKVSVYAPPAATLAWSCQTRTPFGLVICSWTAVPEPGPGLTEPVIVPEEVTALVFPE